MIQGVHPFLYVFPTIYYFTVLSTYCTLSVLLTASVSMPQTPYVSPCRMQVKWMPAKEPLIIRFSLFPLSYEFCEFTHQLLY